MLFILVVVNIISIILFIINFITEMSSFIRDTEITFLLKMARMLVEARTGQPSVSHFLSKRELLLRLVARKQAYYAAANVIGSYEH